MHGARKETAIIKGKEHPNYVHGNETLSARALRLETVIELRELESLCYALGIASGPRWRGRKPKHLK